jgi:MFS family permease
VFMLGLPIGLGISSWIGGVIAQTWGWRAAFYIAGIPGLFCALAALAIREPARGMVEERAIGSRRRAGSPYWLVLTIPTVWWVILSGALHNFNMYALGAFLSPFLIRFHQISIREAGFVTMFVFGLSGIVGLLGGGMVADALYRRRVDGRLLTGTAAITISAPLMYLSLLRPTGDVWMFSVLMGSGIGIMYAYYSSVYATLQDVVEPSLRGTAMALYFCAMYILGASLGPLGTGILSDYYTFKAAAAAGVATERSISELLFDLLPTLIGQSKLGVTPAVEPFRAAGLHSAMYVIPLLASILAAVLFAASRTVKRDVEKLRTWMAQTEAASIRQQAARALIIATLAGPAAIVSAQTPPAQTPPPQTSTTTTSAQTTTGRASVPMPLQKQALQYFTGRWTVEWMGPETPLGPGPYDGTVTFTERDGGKSLEGVTEAKSDAGPYRATATVSFDPEKKTLTWSERRPNGVTVNSVGDWSSPLAIRFDIPPVTVKGETFRLKRTLTIISSGSFTVLEEYSTGNGPFKRLGNGVFAKEPVK